MRNVLLGVLLISSFGVNAAGKTEMYSLSCANGNDNKQSENIRVIDGDLTMAIVGKQGDDFKMSGKGVYFAVDGVSESKMNIMVYGHAVNIDKDALKKAGEFMEPVSWIDSFSLVSTGEGASKIFNWINVSGNHTCKTIAYQLTPATADKK